MAFTAVQMFQTGAKLRIRDDGPFLTLIVGLKELWTLKLHVGAYWIHF